jgi:hypothetical protein
MRSVVLVAAAVAACGNREATRPPPTGPHGLPVAPAGALSAADVTRWCDGLRRAVDAATAGRAAAADVVFTAPPPRAAPGVSTVVVHRGVVLRVPALPYRCGLEHVGRGFDLVLADPGSRTTIVVGEMIGGEPLDDLFATAGGAAPPRRQRERFTEWLFPELGSDPDLYDLDDVAYRVRPGELACDAGRLREATRDAYALVLKVAGGGDAIAARAHRGVGLADSHVFVRDDARGLHHVRYDFLIGEVPSSLALSTADPTLADAQVALLDQTRVLGGGGGGGGVVGWPSSGLGPICDAAIRLADVASPTDARALLDQLGDAAEHAGLRAALERYLGAR